jgi:hypothetical protein
MVFFRHTGSGQALHGRMHQKGGSGMHLPKIVYIYINLISHDL